MQPVPAAPTAIDPANAALTASLRDARATYPGVVLSDQAFARHVSAKVASEGTALHMLRTRELFLACACAQRDRAALAYFERDVFVEVDAVYARFADLPLTLDDVKQRLREKLLLSDPGVLAYAGKGPLRGWVRAAALHALLNIAQRERREQPSDAALFEAVIGSEPSAEAAYVKLACRAEFEAAFAFALESLSDRERVLLRHAFVDGRSVDEIGPIYGVHRATAARWISAARDQLVLRTRADLMRRLDISEAEARSIILAALSGVGSMLLRKLA